MGFNLISCTPMSGSYILYGSILEEWGLFFFLKRSFFRADMAALGKYRMGGYGRNWLHFASRWLLLGFSVSNIAR